VSDTPRTDVIERAEWPEGDPALGEDRAINLCRELERELQEAQAKLQWFMQNQNQIAMDIIRPVQEENAMLRESMQEAWKLVNAMAGQEYWDRAEDWLAENRRFAPEGIVASTGRKQAMKNLDMEAGGDSVDQLVGEFL
jgi:hypothetical protein